MTRFKIVLMVFGMSLFCCGCGGAVSRKTGAPEEFKTVIANMALRFEQLSQGKPVRLAALPFASTQFTEPDKCDFGPYITESLINVLGSSPGKIRLFERSRLDAITRENALTLSGLISQSDAKKIGELAPIDYILTGTFTKLESYVEVNGRILNVVSGQIELTFSQKISLTPDIASLFPEARARQTAQPKEEGETGKKTDISNTCPPEVALLDSLLGDLTSPGKIDHVVSTAITIPFTLPCGAVHDKVLHSFTRYKIFNDKYKRFLLKTLSAIDDPDKDYYRITGIFAYLHADSVIDDEEWNAGLGVLERSGDLQHVYFSHLFVFNGPGAVMDREYSHIDSYFALLRQKKIGRLVALTYDAAFMAIFSALRDRRDDPDNRLLHYCLSKYGRDVSDKSIERINDALEDLYKGVYNKKGNWQEKKRLLDEICDNFNRLSPCEKLAEEMMGFGKSLKEQTGKKPMPGERKQATADHLKYFATACGKKLSSAVSLLPQGRMSKEAVLFCLTNGLPAPAQTPTTDDLEKSLFADNINDKMDAAEYLAAMGAGAAGSEEKVVKCLRRAEHMNVSGTTNLQWTLVSVLGNIRARSPEALEILMSMLEKGDYVVPDSAMAALGRIGRPVLPLLHSAYDSKEDFVKIRIVKTIVLMGKDARSETAFLKSQAAKAQNADLKDVLNDALEDIQREK